jgi:hypothetical protein
MVPPVPQGHPGHPRKNGPPVLKDRAVTFLGVSREGEFKNTTQMFLQKVHSPCRKISPKIDKIFDVRFPPILVFAAMGVEKH